MAEVTKKKRGRKPKNKIITNPDPVFDSNSLDDILITCIKKPKNNINIELGHNLKKHLKSLKKRMKESAENLEFEEAAKIRDEIRKLEASELEITLNPKISQYKLKNKVYPKGRSTMGMPGTRPRKAIKKWKQKK